VIDASSPLWTLRRGGKEVACTVRLMPYGIEADIVHDGAVVLTRVFETEDEVRAWADEKRARREQEGWVAARQDASQILH
jgi:hypothetical protein